MTSPSTPSTHDLIDEFVCPDDLLLSPEPALQLRGRFLAAIPSFGPMVKEFDAWLVAEKRLAATLDSDPLKERIEHLWGNIMLMMNAPFLSTLSHEQLHHFRPAITAAFQAIYDQVIDCTPRPRPSVVELLMEAFEKAAKASEGPRS